MTLSFLFKISVHLNRLNLCAPIPLVNFLVAVPIYLLTLFLESSKNNVISSTTLFLKLVFTFLAFFCRFDVHVGCIMP